MTKMEHLRTISDDQIVTCYCDNDYSISKVLLNFGFKTTSNDARRHIGTILEKYDAKRSGVFDRIIKHPNIENLIKSASCLAEILEHVNLSNIRTNRYNLANAIRHLKLDAPDWKLNKAALRKKILWGRDKEIFRNFSNEEHLPSQAIIKDRYLAYRASNDLTPQCDKCSLGMTWQNEPIVLQLDHVDGNKYNNVLTNLRLLCPNCHSQTKTFCRKNEKRYE